MGAEHLINAINKHAARTSEQQQAYDAIGEFVCDPLYDKVPQHEKDRFWRVLWNDGYDA